MAHGFTSVSAACCAVMAIVSHAADGEPQPSVPFARAASGWQTMPDLDGEVRWEDAPPPTLTAQWLVHAMSQDAGRSVGLYAEPKRFLRLSRDGWQLPDARPGSPVRKYHRIGRLADIDGAETWLIVLQEDAKPVIVHVPPDSEYFVARQFKKGTIGDEWVEDIRWIVTAEGRQVAAAAPAAAAPAAVPRTEPRAPGREPEVAGGVIPIEYLSPWRADDARTMLELFKREQWPQPQSLTSGLMVHRAFGNTPDGLQVYDLIYKVGDVWLRSAEDVTGALAALKAGAAVEIRVKRLQPNSKGVPTWMPIVLQVTPVTVEQSRQLAEQDRRVRGEQRAKRIRDRIAGRPTITDTDGVVELFAAVSKYILVQERHEPRIYIGAMTKFDKGVGSDADSNERLLNAMRSFTPVELECLEDLAISTDWGRQACRQGRSNAEMLLDGFALLEGRPVMQRPAGPRDRPVANAGAREAGAFRDMSWGDLLTDDFTRAGDPGDGSILYKRRGDKLQIGDAPLKTILYAFRNGRLERVMVMCDPSDAEIVERGLSTKYGDPAPAAGVLNWMTDDTMISLDRSTGVCLFSPKTVVDRTLRERADADRRAADDL